MRKKEEDHFAYRFHCHVLLNMYIRSPHHVIYVIARSGYQFAVFVPPMPFKPIRMLVPYLTQSQLQR